jgi:hypothetical protein
MTDAPDTMADLRRDLARGLALLAEKEPGYREALEYYEGTRAEVSSSTTIQRLIEQQAKATPISLAHIPVDTVMEKVDLVALKAVDATADKALTDVLVANDLDDEVDDWLKKAGYLGDYYAIVDPTEEEAESGRATVEGLKVVGSSPFSTIVIYDPKDERTPLYGVKVWKSGSRWRALMYYHGTTVKLITGEQSAGTKADDFVLDFEAEEADAYLTHLGDRMLIAHLAIGGRPYGVPLHRRAWGPQDAITKVSATNLNNVDAQGFASRWAIADPLAEIDDDIDDDFGTDGPTTAAADRDGLKTATGGSARVRSEPGAIAMLRGVKAVGQFAATSSEDFLKNLDWYIRVMAVATGTPLFEFDLNGEQPSGEARRRAEGRVIRKAAKVRVAAGAFLRELGGIVLSTLGIDSAVDPIWQEGEVASDKEGIELVSAKIKAGVPVRQALIEAGYPEADVEDWYPEGDPAVTPELLGVLAQALQQLGQARTLGVINDEELADMLPTILTSARGEGPAASVPAPPAPPAEADVEAPTPAQRAAALVTGA